MVKAFIVSTSEPVSKEELDSLGVLQWKLDADNYDSEGKLKTICEERGYTYKDVVHIQNTVTPDYEAKLKIFFTEHLHLDEEIRFFLDGSGYFDIRSANDDWIRIHCEKGDLIILV
eukprot:TRINITY_DN3058_c0_g1_i3.p1 TRINITY_DN3058_c0_g1~~TRINITY_DN3058_c0_g1_i3.p1  ORF type:complete len:116 (-),score=17.16 TRINITY_DN3058_c0_g1_i3:361-708(-)